MTRTGTVPALLAGAGSARGRPQAGICSVPVPKKATSGGSRSGSGPTGQHAPAWLWPRSPSPALLCPATSKTHVCCHPTVGTPLSPVPWGPHNQPKGEHGVTALLCTSLPREKLPGSPPPPHQLPRAKPDTRIGQGAAPAPGTGWEQSHTRTGRDRLCCRGFHQDWPMSRFLHWAGQCMDSHMRLGSNWILIWGWSVHGFSPENSKPMDSHTGLASTWILTRD